MKKTIGVAVALLFLLGATSFTFAQEKRHQTAKTTQENVEIISGKIVSIDQAKKEIVVKDNKTQADRTVMVSVKAITALKIGDEVKVKVKVGSAQAESVTVLKKSETKKKQ